MRPEYRVAHAVDELTDATITTSRRSASQAVALWRIRSISSLMEASFSMKVSEEAM